MGIVGMKQALPAPTFTAADKNQGRPTRLPILVIGTHLLDRLFKIGKRVGRP